MNRREAFKAIIAGAVALLGLKGLAAREPQFIGVGTLHVTEAEAVNQFTMGETAHWPQTRQLGISYEMADPTPEQCAWYDKLSRRVQATGNIDAVETPDFPGELAWRRV